MSGAFGPEWVGQLILGRYRVIQCLARGGMGIVYLGRLEGAAGFAKPVVLKRIIPVIDDLEQSTAQFIREAQILSNLQHPGIVSVLDFGKHADSYAMVLEYVSGYDLGRWLEFSRVAGRRLDWEHTALIGVRVLEALAYAHEFRRSDGSRAEVLHRDISPGNILLDADGRVRLLDFGIAHMAIEGNEHRTRTGVLQGKIGYLAPELLSGARASRASDIYACGVVLYKMLSGAHPFGSDGEGQLMWRAMMEPPRPISELRPDLPRELEACVLRALLKDPQRRTADAARFAAELRACLRRDEAQVAATLRELVSADFEGQMPRVLRLESLRARDRAWRATPSAPDAVSPGAPELSGPETLALGPASDANASAPPDTALHDAEVVSLEPRRRWRQSLVFAAGLCLVLAASLINLLASFSSSAPEDPPRFIVVGAPDKARSKAAAASPSPPASNAPGVLGRAGETGTNERRQQRAPLDEPARLTRQFGRQRASLQACFERFAEPGREQPEISVHFDVAATGKVNTAALRPSRLEPTRLGQCLLGVARGARFSELARPMRFSIPIEASASRK